MTTASIVPIACALLRRLEALRLKAYPDAKRGWALPTVGYGATGPGITRDTVWTKDQAEADLAARVTELAEEVSRLVRVPLPDQCKAVLVSFAYNAGLSKFAGSTLLRRINQGAPLVAADEFRRWVYAEGEVLPGLVKRREIEREAFLAGLRGAA